VSEAHKKRSCKRWEQIDHVRKRRVCVWAIDSWHLGCACRCYSCHVIMLYVHQRCMTNDRCQSARNYHRLRRWRHAQLRHANSARPPASNAYERRVRHRRPPGGSTEWMLNNTFPSAAQSARTRICPPDRSDTYAATIDDWTCSTTTLLSSALLFCKIQMCLRTIRNDQWITVWK